ncbi:MAG: hypothetical protein KAH18_02320 [Psychromonas sp.]|nr:hypothetical protein [Psychromonas sp.]
MLKFKMIIKIVILLLLIEMLEACKTELNPGPPPLPSSPASLSPSTRINLQGIWNTDCKAVPVDNRYGFIKTLTITGDILREKSTYYLDDSCLMPALSGTVISRIKIGSVQNKGESDEFINFDITPFKIEQTLLLSAFVDWFNVSLGTGSLLGLYSNYGLYDWNLNVTKDISKFALAQKRFGFNVLDRDIYQIQVNKLFRGDKKGDLDPDGRPTTLEKIYANFTKPNL